MWDRIEHTLLKIIPKNVTTHEKAFGLQPITKNERDATILRNWLTFTLRHCIMLEERKAYYKRPTKNDEWKFITKLNHKIQQEAEEKYLQYKYGGKETKFEKIVTTNNAIAKKIEQSYNIGSVI